MPREMIMSKTRLRAAVTLLAALPVYLMEVTSAQEMNLSGGGGTGDVSKFPKELTNRPAAHVPHPEAAAFMAAVRAGKRTVAVGDHGTILLSDNDGKTWRQARDVPTRVMMNSVCFIDGNQGWAAGHWGEIIHTTDGGETWKLQRMDTAVDQPLFSVHFSDSSNGLAVGLWSLALRTTDGGVTWTAVKMPTASEKEKAGPNLYQIVPGKGGVLYVAAEQGQVFKSSDAGKSWAIIKTGNKGSFWTGLVMPDDAVLMAGLNGKILRSTDAGKTWKEVDSGTGASITSLVPTTAGGIVGSALEGVTLDSKDGLAFQSKSRHDRAPLTGVLMNSENLYALISKSGILAGDEGSSYSDAGQGGK